MTNPEPRALVSGGVILLAIGLINGFLIEVMPLARLALSAHLVGLMGSAFLIALGAAWPALALTGRASRLAALAALYGFCGGWMIYFFAAATGTGGMFPLASGGVRGSSLLETVTSIALLSVALALLGFCGIVLTRMGRAGDGAPEPRRR